MRPRSAPDELCDELRCRVGEDLLGRAELRQEPAHLEHGDEVAHSDRLVDVVGHEEHRLGELALEAQQLLLEPLANERIDRPERLVHEQDRRVRRERPGDADSLALAARQLRREPRAVRGRVETDEREQLLGACPPPSLGPAEQARHGRDVLEHGLVREQAGLLDHVADAAAQLDRVARLDVHAVEQDLAARRLDEPVDHLERRRLAAA